MKIERKELISALNKAKRFTASEADMLILQLVLIDGANQQIVATDIDTRCEVPVSIRDFKRKVKSPDGSEVEIDEKFCVDPGNLLKIVHALDIQDGQDVSLVPGEFEFPAVEESMFEGDLAKPLALTVGEYFQKLIIKPAEDFPKWTDVTKSDKIMSITGNNLKRVAEICSDSDFEYREVVMFDCDRQQIVASDGVRLHILKTPDLKGKDGFTIQHGAVKGVAALAGSEEVFVMLCGTKRRVQFIGDGFTVTSRITGVEFPDYADRIREKSAHHVVVHRETFRKAVTQANLICGKDHSLATLSFNKGVSISIENPSKGLFSRENVPFKGKVDPAVNMRLPVKHLMGLLSAAGGKKLDLEIEDKKGLIVKSGLFTGYIISV